MSAHALLSASSAYRWMSCPPSARLEAQFPDSSSEYAALGTHAHAWGEMRLRHYFEVVAPKQRRKDEAALKASEYHSDEVEDAVEVYVALAKTQYKEAKKHCADPLVLIEEKLDLSDYVPEGFGTVDCIIVGNDTLYVIDYKHGQGVAVSAEDNPQMRLYALGALSQYGDLFDIKTVCVSICQPRMDSTTTEEMSIESLSNWAETVLKPAAQIAFAGEGECQTGSHCKFCRAKAACRAYGDEQLALAKETFAFELPKLLSNVEIAEVLGKRDELKKWLDEVYQYALTQARDAGEHFPGYKLVEGRANRKYKSEQEVLDYLTQQKGYDKDKLTETALLGLTKLTKLIGAKDVAELEQENLLIKPPGAPTLVSEDDERPALDAVPDEFKEAI